MNRKKTETGLNRTAVQSFLRLQLPYISQWVGCSCSDIIFIENRSKPIKTGSNRLYIHILLYLFYIVGHAQEKENANCKSLYMLRLRTDHLVTFAHPNEKVVPLLFTIPHAAYVNINNHRHYPRHCRYHSSSASFQHHHSVNACVPHIG
jgi:hypothetical protein